LLQQLTKAMQDLSETVESLKKEKSAVVAERDALKTAERQRVAEETVGRTTDDVNLQALNDIKQKLTNRETIIENQTKSIHEFREKLRTKEVELRMLNERQRNSDIEWNKQVSELKNSFQSEKEQCENEKKALSEQLSDAFKRLRDVENSTDKRNADSHSLTTQAADVETDQQNLITELRLAKEKNDSEKVRLEREVKMLNETLYSTVAARNKVTQEYKALQEQLQSERSRFSAHEQVCAKHVCESRQDQENSFVRNDETTRTMNELKSELTELTKQNASLKEQVKQLSTEKVNMDSRSIRYGSQLQV